MTSCALRCCSWVFIARQPLHRNVCSTGRAMLLLPADMRPRAGDGLRWPRALPSFTQQPDPSPLTTTAAAQNSRIRRNVQCRPRGNGTASPEHRPARIALRLVAPLRRASFRGSTPMKMTLAVIAAIVAAAIQANVAGASTQAGVCIPARPGSTVRVCDGAAATWVMRLYLQQRYSLKYPYPAATMCAPTTRLRWSCTFGGGGGAAPLGTVRVVFRGTPSGWRYTVTLTSGGLP